MPSFKIDRTTEDIHRELTAILREVKDPRVKDCLLSLVRVEVTNDLSYCTVYVSTMEGMDRTKNAVQGLKSVSYTHLDVYKRQGWSFQILIDWRNSQALSSCRAAKKHISSRRGHSFRIIPSKRANTIL